MNFVNAGQPWLIEHIDELKRRFGEGESLEEISRALGRTPGGIVGKMVQLGLLFTGIMGHYYPMPENAWAMWQEVKALDVKMKAEK